MQTFLLDVKDVQGNRNIVGGFVEADQDAFVEAFKVIRDLNESSRTSELAAR